MSDKYQRILDFYSTPNRVEIKLDEAIQLLCNQLDENKLLQQRLSEAENVIDFYADEFTSWEGQRIVPQDFEITENNRPSGGKKAREYQEKYGNPHKE